MSLSEEVLRQIRCAAPPRQAHLDEARRSRLAELTARLLDGYPESRKELDYYLAIRNRTIPVPEPRVTAGVSGATVVVTGGSGCVGTALFNQLKPFEPGRLISLANTPPERPVPGVEYVHLEVRRRTDVERFLRWHRPDLVFHLAAQRDPGLAEQKVTETACTNVLGTENVVRGAERTGVPRVVYASTGKALRPYTPDVYAGSKRVGEWVVARAAARGLISCSAVRFTHVVDNSIILDRLVRWCLERDLVRLHSADTAFYAQSARESARLMLVAAIAPEDDVCRLHVIRDLGWPVRLIALALGVMSREGTVAPLYIAGHDPGYEERPYPGLYDPAFSGDVSPLVNVMEAAGQVEEAASPAVDAVAVTAPRAPRLELCLRELERLERGCADAVVRRVLHEGVYDLFVATVRTTPKSLVDRVVRLTEPYRSSMGAEHLRMDDVFRQFRTGAQDAPSARSGITRPPAEPSSERSAGTTLSGGSGAQKWFP